MIATPIAETVTPSQADVLLAVVGDRKLSHFLASATKRRGAPFLLTIQSDEQDSESISIPASAFRLLVDILAEMSRGNAVTIIPTKSEITTQQAAEFLNVSRPFVVKQLEANAIPYRLVGTHRRILFSDLLRFKSEMDRKREDALNELAIDAQENNMGY